MDAYDRKKLKKRSIILLTKATSVPYFAINRPLIFPSLILLKCFLLLFMSFPLLGFESYPYITAHISASYLQDPVIDTDLSFTNKFFTLTPIGSEVHLSKLPTSCNTDEVRVDYGDCDLSVVGGSLAMRCRGYSLDKNEVLPIFQNVCQVCKFEMEKSRQYLIATMVVAAISIKLCELRSSNLKDSILLKIALFLVSILGFDVASATTSFSNNCFLAVSKIAVRPFDDEVVVTTEKGFGTSFMDVVVFDFLVLFFVNLFTRHVTKEERAESLAEMNSYKKVKEWGAAGEEGVGGKKEKKTRNLDIYKVSKSDENDEEHTPSKIKRKSVQLKQKKGIAVENDMEIFDLE